jgi:hypothetical protein
VVVVKKERKKNKDERDGVFLFSFFFQSLFSSCFALFLLSLFCKKEEREDDDFSRAIKKTNGVPHTQQLKPSSSLLPRCSSHRRRRRLKKHLSLSPPSPLSSALFVPNSIPNRTAVASSTSSGASSAATGHGSTPGDVDAAATAATSEPERASVGMRYFPESVPRRMALAVVSASESGGERAAERRWAAGDCGRGGGERREGTFFFLER